MGSIIVRLATKNDTESLLRIRQYSECKIGFPHGEDILVAERDGKVLGAVSVAGREITCVPGEWKTGYERHLNTKIENVSGHWISKLYVFPEHRRKGIGTKLVKATVEYLKAKGFTKAYAGIYIKNRCRKTSHRLFERNGFKPFGSCVCFLSEGYCRGALLKKIIKSCREEE